MQLHEISKKNQKIWVCDEVQPYFRPSWFDLRDGNNSRIASDVKGGRQAIKKFSVNNRQFVLRHYYRGGIPAHFTKDRFLFRGWRKTRPYKEITMLIEMSQLGLPVPFPVAARSITGHFSYCADIIMVEIPASESLAAVLKKRKFTAEEWRMVGRTIRRFHRLGFQHVDLNANNILVGHDGNIHLIDFDRCLRRSYKRKWGLAGLARLRRSLIKMQRCRESLNFGQAEFQYLLQGYQE